MIQGGAGNDVIDAGAGNDTLVWNPGDDSNTIDAGAGSDTLFFRGSAADEAIAITSTSTGFQLTRDIGNVALNVAEAEALTLTMIEGTDLVSTEPLAATAQSLDGGADIDGLTVSSAAACIAAGPGTVTFAGSQPIAFAGFETVTLPSACVPVVSIPTLDPRLLALLALLLAGLGVKTLRG